MIKTYKCSLNFFDYHFQKYTKTTKLRYSLWKDIRKFIKTLRLEENLNPNKDLLDFEEETTEHGTKLFIFYNPFDTLLCESVKIDDEVFTHYLLEKIREEKKNKMASINYNVDPNTITSTSTSTNYTASTTSNGTTSNYTINTGPITPDSTWWKPNIDESIWWQPNITTTTGGTHTIDTGKVEIKAKEISLNGEKVTINGKEVMSAKEEKNMKNKFGINFDFGPVTDSNIAVCPFGIAIKNKEGNFCYFDKNKGEIVDCTPFTFDSKKFLFKMPCALSAVAPADIIMHQGVPMFVKDVEDVEGRIVVIDISVGEEKYILPTRNMFGFLFVTKIVSFLDMQNCNATADSPFGNMLPFLMLMDNDKDLDPTMLLMMSGVKGSNMDMSTMFQNPLMMYMMMKDDKDLSKLLPFMLMNNK